VTVSSSSEVFRTNMFNAIDRLLSIPAVGCCVILACERQIPISHILLPVRHLVGGLMSFSILGPGVVLEIPSFSHFVVQQGEVALVRWCWIPRSQAVPGCCDVRVLVEARVSQGAVVRVADRVLVSHDVVLGGQNVFP